MRGLRLLFTMLMVAALAAPVALAKDDVVPMDTKLRKGLDVTDDAVIVKPGKSLVVGGTDLGTTESGGLRVTVPSRSANYATASGTLIDDFEATTGWTNFGSSGTPTVSADTTYFKSGTASLKFDQADASATRVVARYKDFGSAMDLSETDGFSLWTYWPNGKLATNNIAFYLSTDHNFSNFALASLGATITGTQKIGWNKWQFKKSDFSITGTFDWTNVGTIMIKLNTISSADAVYIDGLYVGATARPKIILAMDDGDVSQEDAVDYANSVGIPITLYAIKDYSIDPGTYPGTMPLTTLQRLYDQGNDVGVHHQTNLTTLALGDAETALTDCRAWLINAGMPRAANHIAWPNGVSNTDLRTFAQYQGFKTAASILGATGGVTIYNRENHVNGVANFWTINRMPMSGNNLATVEAQVDACILNGNTLMTYVHTIKGGGEWSVADWQSLCDYIAAKVAAGSVDAVTISQWYDGLRARYAVPAVVY